jgi:predicted P-loop ATPase/GTPase
MDTYSQIVKTIIEHQEAIIGPIAVEQAEAIPGLNVDWASHKVSVGGDGAKIVDTLIKQYKELFGQISVEVCREAASPFMNKLPADKLPKMLA